MSSVDSALVLKPHGTATWPFWPSGRTRLIVVFEILEVDDKVIARGLDPDKDVIVFNTQLRRDQQKAFLKAVIDGVVGEPIHSLPSNENKFGASESITTTELTNPDDGTIVVGGNGGDGPGPRWTQYKVTLAPTAPDTAVATGT